MNQKFGSIELVIGPMFSGKSTELQRRIRRFKFAKKSCAVVKYRSDTRYSKEDMATHDKQFMRAIPASTIEEAFEELMKYDVIGIDEGQFFPDVRTCRENDRYVQKRWSWLKVERH